MGNLTGTPFTEAVEAVTGFSRAFPIGFVEELRWHMKTVVPGSTCTIEQDSLMFASYYPRETCVETYDGAMNLHEAFRCLPGSIPGSFDLEVTWGQSDVCLSDGNVQPSHDEQTYNLTFSGDDCKNVWLKGATSYRWDCHDTRLTEDYITFKIWIGPQTPPSSMCNANSSSFVFEKYLPLNTCLLDNLGVLESNANSSVVTCDVNTGEFVYSLWENLNCQGDPWRQWRGQFDEDGYSTCHPYDVIGTAALHSTKCKFGNSISPSPTAPTATPSSNTSSQGSWLIPEGKESDATVMVLVIIFVMMMCCCGGILGMYCRDLDLSEIRLFQRQRFSRFEDDTAVSVQPTINRVKPVDVTEIELQTREL